MNRWSDVHLLSLARLLSLVWRWLTDVRKKMPEKRLDVNRGSFDYPVLSPVIECCSGLLKISSSFSLHLSFNLEKQKQNGNCRLKSQRLKERERVRDRRGDIWQLRQDVKKPSDPRSYMLLHYFLF